MKKLEIKSWNMDDAVVAQIREYIEGICNSDIALAEPSATHMDWALISLCMSVGECYFAHTMQENSAILGFACVTCSNISVNWQDYSLDPEFAVASMNEYHEGDSCIAVYLEV
jgi:uncharacterized protein YaiE (UPF0345 family)